MLRTGLFLLFITRLGLTFGQQGPDAEKNKLDSLFGVWANTGPGVAVGIVKDGKVRYQYFSGGADVKQGKSITKETTFWIASVSKQFTAMAITVLESDGKLSLEDPVHRYLPETRRFPDVKIKHLLHHTSGLRDGYTLVGMTLRGEKHYDPVSVLQMISQQTELNFKPGSRFEYVNSNYVLLALIVERIAKMPFGDFMKSEVFRPLGMLHARVYDGHHLDSDALGYIRKNKRYKTAGSYLPAIGSSGVMLSMSDAMQLEKEFHQTNRDVRADKMVATSTLDDDSGLHYTRGLEQYIIDSTTVFSHFGSDPGFRADILRIPEERLSIAIFSNASGYWSLNRNLFDAVGIILQRCFRIHSALSSDEHTPLASFAGVYVDTVSGSATRFLRVADGKPTVSNSLNGYYAELMRSSDNTFFKDDFHETSYRFDDHSVTVDRVDGRHVFIKSDSSSFLSESKHLKGKYYSPELGKRYRITYRHGHLRLSFLRLIHSRLYPVGKNSFYSEFAGGNVLTFIKEADEDILLFNRDGVKNLRFKKLKK